MVRDSRQHLTPLHNSSSKSVLASTPILCRTPASQPVWEVHMEDWELLGDQQARAQEHCVWSWQLQMVSWNWAARYTVTTGSGLLSFSYLQCSCCRYILVYPHGCDVCNHLSLFLCVADYDKLLPGTPCLQCLAHIAVPLSPAESCLLCTLMVVRCLATAWPMLCFRLEPFCSIHHRCGKQRSQEV